MSTEGENGSVGGAKRWPVVLAAFLFVGVGAGVLVSRLGPQLSPKIPDRDLSEAEKEKVFECMEGALLHEAAAKDCVYTYGWQALPFYHAVIQNSDEVSRVRGNAAMLAGLYEDPATAELIIGFVESIIRDDMSSTRLSAVAIALDGLGFSGGETAVSWLDSLARGMRWDEAAIEADGEAERIRRILVKRGIRALGLVPDGGGIVALKRLEDDMPEYAGVVETALDDAGRRRLGLNRLEALR